ncbi:MAG: site-2 protease family protein [Cephaloticoccus sp.]|nr:site-2 protease family protein [Cephaloticoccus sp.]MCF7761213.1 site-2 protease family protein [Cephaloticoccus sp.]
MDFGLDPETLRNGLLLYIVLIGSLCIHEWAHAITADKLGDYTPASEGRVTLNPVAHMDLMGSVILPLLFIFVFPVGMLFGWGKPVRINPSNFTHRKRDELLTTIAGPGSNIILALLAAILGGLLYRFEPRTTELFGMVIRINVLLAVFNMIPLPPLDGGQVMRHMTNMSEETFYNISRWSFFIILIAINIPAFRMLLGAVMAVVSWPMMMIYSALAG